MLTALMTLTRKPTAKEMATRELEDAKRELLLAQTSCDYAKAIVEYQSDRIKRLESMIAKDAL